MRCKPHPNLGLVCISADMPAKMHRAAGLGFLRARSKKTESNARDQMGLAARDALDANGPRASDSVCFLPGPGKTNPAAQRIFVGLSSVTQTRPKFGRGLCCRVITAVSTNVLLLSPGGPRVIDRGRFVSCTDSVACTGKGCTTASAFMLPSMALYH
jgi:hypothetical protein